VSRPVGVGGNPACKTSQNIMAIKRLFLLIDYAFLYYKPKQFFEAELKPYIHESFTTAAKHIPKQELQGFNVCIYRVMASWKMTFVFVFLYAFLQIALQSTPTGSPGDLYFLLLYTVLHPRSCGLLLSRDGQ
jgi:hypothetical protein